VRSNPGDEFKALDEQVQEELWENYKERILGLNEKIEEITSRLNINFVYMFEAFWNHPDPLYSDANHPNEENYKEMAETWYEAFVPTLLLIEIDPTSLRHNVWFRHWQKHLERYGAPS